MATWENYHFTNEVTATDHRRFNADGHMRLTPGMTGPQMLVQSTKPLKDHMKLANQRSTNCGLIGKAWSFSELTGNAALQLECGGKLTTPIDAPLADHSGLVGLIAFDSASAHPQSTLSASHLAWVRGGTTMREIAEWSEARGLSLFTSGDQLGPSLAGAIASGTHGSRRDYGAVQNMVRGLHLITGSGSSLWIEPADHPVLADHVALRFADKVVRDTEQFADSLVHLGAMGIVNGAVIELDNKHAFNRRVPIVSLDANWDEWLKAVMRKDFDAVAQLLGHDRSPIFYECSINPFDPKKADSVHIMYFPVAGLVEKHGPARTPRPADGVYYAAQRLEKMELEMRAAGAIDVPAYYIGLVRDELRTRPQDSLAWSSLHWSDEETAFRGALFNAGFAIPLSQLDRAIAAMCTSVADMNGDRQFVFTFRFVTGAVGRMRHLRWADSVAIELDGLSKKFCDLNRFPQNSTQALTFIQDAFDHAGIDYAMHWGKLGNRPDIVQRNFGGVGVPGSPIDLWHKTRAALLTAEGERTMRNNVVIKYGMV